MERLFCYGTLLEEEVQRAVIGRAVKMLPDALAGYRLAPLAVRDPAAVATSGIVNHLTVVPAAESSVPGMLLYLTGEELAAIDRYEGGDYRRIAATFGSGAQGWVYVRPD